MEEKKNKNMVVIIIILCLLLVGAVGFIVYDKSFRTNQNNNNQENEKIQDKEELDIKNEYVLSLYRKATGSGQYIAEAFTRDANLEDVYYDFDKTLATELTHDSKMFLAFASISDEDKDHIDINNSSEDMSKNTYTFHSAVLKEAFKKVFGENVSFENGDFDYPECKYDKDNDIYTCKFDGGASMTGVSSNMVSAYKYSDRIEINVSAGRYEPSNDTKVDLGNYKYTFKLEDGNYYFYSVEKIK